MLHLYLSLGKAYLPEAFTHGDPQLVPGLVLDGLAVALP
jgi:hypothetical protein